eukprot:TRINITY_DN6708_c0_g1_i2.p1 TRINITY_DN6708_c0_g1~~TRINITY_DN6708_c0_g1_i2.p1  ORF type:complete len:119 (-),score=45.58 TRINITY_DN6708_c0_g1_i2:33-389(-)
MTRLSHILAQEIYAHQEEQMNQVNPWTDEKETETNENLGKKEGANLFQSETAKNVDYDSSKESVKDDLALLKISSAEDDALDRMMDEGIDYIMSAAADWDDSEEYEDESAEADYYNYY